MKYSTTRRAKTITTICKGAEGQMILLGGPWVSDPCYRGILHLDLLCTIRIFFYNVRHQSLGAPCRKLSILQWRYLDAGLWLCTVNSVTTRKEHACMTCNVFAPAKHWFKLKVIRTCLGKTKYFLKEDVEAVAYLRQMAPMAQLKCALFSIIWMLDTGTPVTKDKQITKNELNEKLK